MSESENISRRAVLKSSAFGLLALSLPQLNFAQSVLKDENELKSLRRYPAIDDAIVAEVVGAAHFNLDRVKELVDKRPELARATWDWGYGDWETALGAASHVGRRDIMHYLIGKGARPDLFTFASLGMYETVKAIIESNPGIEKIRGPHGISLMRHASAGADAEDLSEKDKKAFKKLIGYLEKLEGADDTTVYFSLTDEEKQKYLGDYKYGDEPDQGFTIKLNMRKLLSIGKPGKSGGGLLPIEKNLFEYNGAPSTRISFLVENDVVKSLTVTEPDLSLTAEKVG